MRGAILPLLQYALMAWCSFKAQGQLYKSICDLDLQFFGYSSDEVKENVGKLSGKQVKGG
jgi:hypothetical protein